MERCFEMLQEIENNELTDPLEFRDDTRLEEIYKSIVADNQSCLQKAKFALTASEEQHKIWVSELESAKNRLKRLENELSQVNKNFELSQKGFVSSCNNLQDIEDKKSSILSLKGQLKVYREMTGVHLAFDSPQEVVAGCVAVKGPTPPESKQKPFIIDSRSSTIQNEIWEHIENVASDKTDYSVIYGEY